MELLELRVSVRQTPLADARLHLHMVHLHPLNNNDAYRVLLAFLSLLRLLGYCFRAADGEFYLGLTLVVEQLASAGFAQTSLALLHR